MVTQWIGVGFFSAGVVIGVAVTALRPEPVVSAQTTAWQCRSFTRESKESADTIGTWLGAAARVEIAAAGLSVAERYVLVACKK